MASVNNTDKQLFPLDIKTINLTIRPQSVLLILINPNAEFPLTPEPSRQRQQTPDALRLLKYHIYLTDVTGPDPSYSLVLTSHTTSRSPLFVNACVYIPENHELYLTSSLLPSTSSSQLPQVLISKVSLARSPATPRNLAVSQWQKLRSPSSMPNPAGACAYADGIVYCSQGTLDPDTGGIVYMAHNKPPVQVVAQYGGKRFNSLQRVAVSPTDGSLWFTDSDVGFEAGIREKGELPNLVFQYDPRKRFTRAVADGLGRPGAIAFAPDGETLYISDVEATRTVQGAVSKAPTIYAYDIIIRHEQSFLTNKRVFAVIFDGFAADVKCDSKGNVYAACGDGVEIWSPGGVPLALIEIAGGCSSLCFGKDSELFVGAGQRLWNIQL